MKFSWPAWDYRVEIWSSNLRGSWNFALRQIVAGLTFTFREIVRLNDAIPCYGPFLSALTS